MIQKSNEQKNSNASILDIEIFGKFIGHWNPGIGI